MDFSPVFGETIFVHPQIFKRNEMEQIRTQLEHELFKLSDEGWAYILTELGEQPTLADIKRFVIEVRSIQRYYA